MCDHFIDRRLLMDDLLVSDQLCFQQDSFLADEFSVQNIVKPCDDVFRRNIDQEAKPAEINPDDRHVEGCEVSSGRQQGAIAPDGDCKVAMPADIPDMRCFYRLRVNVLPAFRIDHDLEFPVAEMPVDFAQGVRDVAAWFADQGDGIEMAIHGERKRKQPENKGWLLNNGDSALSQTIDSILV